MLSKHYQIALISFLGVSLLAKHRLISKCRVELKQNQVKQKYDLIK